MRSCKRAVSVAQYFELGAVSVPQMFEKAWRGSANSLNIQETLKKTRTGSASAVNVQQRLMISGTYNVKSQFFKTLLMLVVVFQAKLASRKGARKLIAVLQVLVVSTVFFHEGWYKFSTCSHYVGAGGCPACGVCTSQMFVKACICTATADSISHRLVIADRGPASAVKAGRSFVCTVR